MLDQITPMVITFNEEANIGRVMDKLSWARDIVVVDSGSTDRTLEIIGTFPQARVITRAFDSFANQCNFGLDHIQSEWVLSIDADYVLTDAMIAELTAMQDDGSTNGYQIGFAYCIDGKLLSGTLYPSRTSLYRAKQGRYVDAGHAHRLQIAGAVGKLKSLVLHDDRKPLSRWLDAQRRYAVREADHLLSAPSEALRRTDKLRLKGWPAPIIVFFYTLLWKRCLFDGRVGWTYVMQRTYAELLLALELGGRKS